MAAFRFDFNRYEHDSLEADVIQLRTRLDKLKAEHNDQKHLDNLAESERAINAFGTKFNEFHKPLIENMNKGKFEKAKEYLHQVEGEQKKIVDLATPQIEASKKRLAALEELQKDIVELRKMASNDSNDRINDHRLATQLTELDSLITKEKAYKQSMEGHISVNQQAVDTAKQSLQSATKPNEEYHKEALGKLVVAVYGPRWGTKEKPTPPFVVELMGKLGKHVKFDKHTTYGQSNMREFQQDMNDLTRKEAAELFSQVKKLAEQKPKPGDVPDKKEAALINATKLLFELFDPKGKPKDKQEAINDFGKALEISGLVPAKAEAKSQAPQQPKVSATAAQPEQPAPSRRLGK